MSTIFLLSLFLLSFTSSVLSVKDDEKVLLKMKKQLGNPDILRSWVKGFKFCDISTFDTNSTSLAQVHTGCTSNGRVSSLSVAYFDITAPFPDDVCGLTELHYLGFHHMPGLYGPIPSCITKLFNLHHITIRETSLSGSVPSFYNHPNITTIDLQRNHLSGKIPPTLSTLPNLNYLDLYSNYLTGTIPPGVVPGLFPYLRLANNNLTGELPKSYGWQDFSTIDLGHNRLSGDASFLLGKQKKTISLVLANNDFEFDLSCVEFSDSLSKFDVSNNKIYGKVPESFATASRLHYANLSFNRLCGELPQIGNMWKFNNASAFTGNACLCGYPLPPCSIWTPPPAPVSEPSCYISAPPLAPVSEPPCSIWTPPPAPISEPPCSISAPPPAPVSEPPF